MNFSLLIILAFIKCAALKELRDMSIPELIDLAENVSESRPRDVRTADVSFFLFTRNSSKIGIKIDGARKLDGSKMSKIIIHGWLENHERSWYRLVTEELLKYGDFNVVQVDWERVAKSSYVSSAQNTKLVGDLIGNFIIHQNLSADLVHLIGHSLGAHVAAFAAKRIKTVNHTQIHRITGLDPAGPYFREFFITKNDRLSRSDALIVDAIHTDGGFYGYDRPIGTLDIYPNGGKRIQPGCFDQFRLMPIGFGALIENTFCSHAKSTLYFIEMINKKHYICTKCESYGKFLNGSCDHNRKYMIGAEDITPQMTGKCYMITETTIKPLNFNWINSVGGLF